MKSTAPRHRIVIVSFVLLCFFASCSATPSKRSFGEVVDDNVIAVKLRSKYVKDKVLSAKNVNIKVRKGVVQLDGTLATQRQINRAIELAEQQRGVREVKAYLVLGGESKTARAAKPKKNFFSFLKVRSKSNSTTKASSTSKVVESDLTDMQGSQINKNPKPTSNVDSQDTAKTTQNGDDFEELGY